MSDIENMVSALVSGDRDSAVESFNRIFAQRASDALDSYKQEVGSSLMNGGVTEGRNSDADADEVESTRNLKQVDTSGTHKDAEKGWVNQSADYKERVKAARVGKLKDLSPNK